MHKNFFEKTAIIFTLVLIILFSSNLSSFAVDIGGSVEVNSNYNFIDNNLTQSYFTQLLNLKLYIPGNEKTEAKVDFDITKVNNETSSSINKLYLKKNFSNFNISLGRQPISWAFGSLINPVDFNVGAEVMNEARSIKYADAAKLYIPINWKSGLELVAEPKYNIDSTSEKKVGLRARTMINDFDLSFNFVQEPIPSKINRLGVSLKGDIGPLGTYSALSYEEYINFDKKEEVYLVGFDYSKKINYDKRIYLQGEILNLSSSKIKDFATMMPTSPMNLDLNTRYNLFLGNINYTLNQFSNINLMVLANIDDGSLVTIPQYNNQLPGNLDLTFGGSVALGDNTDIFNDNLPISLSLNLKYPF